MEYEMTLPFLTGDAQWCYGFECGKLYAEMQQGVSPIENVFHRANDEMMFMMAQRLGYSVEWEPVDETWFQATFTR